MPQQLFEPWKSFFDEIDAALNQEVIFHCLGGFVAKIQIERNSQRDRDDVKHLARVVPFDLTVLRRRFEDELRPNLAIPEREALTTPTLGRCDQ